MVDLTLYQVYTCLRKTALFLIDNSSKQTELFSFSALNPLNPHPIANGLHVTQLLGKQAAGFTLPPVSRSMERSPAIVVFRTHIQTTLTQQSERERERERERENGRRYFKSTVSSI